MAYADVAMYRAERKRDGRPVLALGRELHVSEPEATPTLLRD